MISVYTLKKLTRALQKMFRRFLEESPHHKTFNPTDDDQESFLSQLKEHTSGEFETQAEAGARREFCPEEVEGDVVKRPISMPSIYNVL